MTSSALHASAPPRPSRAGFVAVAEALRGAGALWEASDLEQLIAATGNVVRTLLPDALVEVCTAVAGAEAAANAATGEFEIPLTPGRVLAVRAPNVEAGRETLAAVAATVARRVAALDAHTQLQEAMQHLGRAERLQRALYAIADQAGAAGDDLTPMFEALHRIVGTLMYAENFYIARYDHDHARVRFVYYADAVDPELPSPEQAVALATLAGGPTYHVLQLGRSLRGTMAAIGTAIGQEVRGVGALPTDWLGVPLLRDGDVVGCVAVQSYDDRHHYDAADQSLLTFVAQHIETALERRLARVELEQRVHDRTSALSAANLALQAEVRERERGERVQAALFRIAELASATDHLGDFYPAVHRVVGELLDARNFYIALLAAGGAGLIFPYQADAHGQGPESRAFGNGLTEYVLRHGAALRADTETRQRLYASGEVSRHGTAAACWLGVPLVRGERTIGVLAVQSYVDEHAYSARDQELLTFVSYHIADALARIETSESLHRTLLELETRVETRTRELALANRGLQAQIAARVKIEERLAHAASHDPLTDLPNRALFLERLTAAFARRDQDPAQGFAVLFADLDHFKSINDSEGHLAGDALLVAVAGRLRDAVKEHDVVARLGGDEFGIILNGVPDAAAARQIAERILDSLDVPFGIAGKAVCGSASIGVAMAAAQHGKPEDLLRDADSAMYRAKAGGRRRCAVFDPHADPGKTAADGRG